jgi:tetratricopeptide (TPR) repeat protein
MKVKLVTVCVAALLCVAGPAFSGGSGGGGGSSAPSSGPSYDPVEEYQKGVEAFQAGDFKAAEKAMKRVVSAVPKDANSQYVLGMALLAQDKAAAAVKPLKLAVKYNPALYDAQGKLGAAYIRSGKPEEAVPLSTGLAAAKATCAETCAEAAVIDAAIAEIEAAQAGGAVVEESALPPQFLPASASAGDLAYTDAVGLINLGQYDTAIEDLKRLQAGLGPHPDVLTYIGFAYRKKGDFDTALSFYSAALTIDPEHLSANEYLGEAYVEQGDIASAEAQLAKLDALCPFGCAQTVELKRWIDNARS